MNGRSEQNPAALRTASGGLRALIIMPALNEEKTLGAVLDRLQETCPDFDRLIVNDGSTDRTIEVARAGGARVVSLPFNSGYGCAVKTGLIYAERNGYDLAVLLDADGQHDPSSIPDVTRPVLEGTADVVLGNRYGDAARRAQGSWLQRTGHKYLSTLLRLLTGKRVSDPMSGFQAISRRALWFYVSNNFPEDYPDTNVLLMLHRAGIRFTEVPAVFHARTTGQSMHGGLLRPLLYWIRATLAILMVLLRPKPRKESKP